MPAIWGRRSARSIEEDREVRLSTGVNVDLSAINLRLGREPTRKQIQDVVDRVQASMDDVQIQADLPPEDPERTWTAAQFTAKYGGRRFLDGANIVDRSTHFSLTWENGRLAPHWSETR